jgi:hypothetical protein
MAFIVADRVQELTSTSGTGTLSLNGASLGYQTFVSGIGSGNYTYYSIYDRNSGIWEVGYGQVNSGMPDTLSRTVVIANSSGTTSPVNLAGNQASVFCTYPAEKAVSLDTNGNVGPLGTITSGTWSADPVNASHGGTGLSSYAIGDIIFASSTNALSKLSIGANTYVLTSNGTTVSWAAPANIPSGLNTQVQFNSAGSFAGASNFTYTGDSLNIPFGPSNSATPAAQVALALAMIA